mgnify:CR=1 FL=1
MKKCLPGLPFIIIGLLMIIWSFFSYINANSFINNAHSTQGSVVSFVESKLNSLTPRGSTKTVYNPVVVFYTSYDKRIKFVAECDYSSTYLYKEQVNVLYDPDDPEDAYMDGARCLKSGSITPGIMGFIISIIGLGLGWVVKS